MMRRTVRIAFNVTFKMSDADVKKVGGRRKLRRYFEQAPEDFVRATLKGLPIEIEGLDFSVVADTGLVEGA